MKLCVVIIIFNLLIVAHGDSRVAGGTDAENGQYPYQVLLKHYSNPKFLCSGSIINKRWILTAAHCLKNITSENLRIIVGTNKRRCGSGLVYQADKIILHENYKHKRESFGAINDIALIHLKRNIIFNNRVKQINLPKDDSDTYENTLVTLTGWGSIRIYGKYATDLQHIQLKVLDPRTCNQTWMNFMNEEIEKTKICTTSDVAQGSCYGDSGGPIAFNGTQVGIVSYGWPCATGVPDVFTRVSSYLDWIKNKTLVRYS